MLVDVAGALVYPRMNELGFVLGFPGTAMATNMSKKRKFVADGVFYAELNEVS